MKEKIFKFIESKYGKLNAWRFHFFCKEIVNFFRYLKPNFAAILVFSIFSFLFGLLFLYIEITICLLGKTYLPSILLFFLTLFIVGSLFYTLCKIKEKLQIQKIYNQYSTIKLLYISFFWSAPLFSIILYLLHYHILSKKYVPFLAFIIVWVIVSIIIVVIGIFICFKIKKQKNVFSWKYCRFAPESVSINKDELDFEIPAKNESEKIAAFDNYINVVALYCKMGGGKSSFTRMIVEELPVRETLHTYISLTETNEAKSFSKLFSQRWFETLSECYPLFNVFDTLTMMSILFRENNNNSLAAFCSFISKINFGIQKTKAKVYDKELCYKPEYVSENIARLFSFIPEIKEKRWVIVIDEIERAKSNEIYRVIESIERFKAEGRSGLPVQITFILCISKSDLEVAINKYKETIPEYFHIKNFFINDQKSFTRRIFLPPMSYEKKVNYIFDRLKSLREEFNIKNDLLDNLLLNPIKFFEKTLGSDYQNRIVEQTYRNSGIKFEGKIPNEKILNHVESFEAIIETLVEQTPRIIKQTIAALHDFYNIFVTKDSKHETKKHIRFTDLLRLSYIRVKYPFLIDFFTNTIQIFIDNEKFIWGKKKPDSNIYDWVYSITKHESDNIEKNEYNTLIEYAAPYYINDEKYKITDIADSTILPENLLNYLSAKSNVILTMTRPKKLYLMHNDFSNLNKYDAKDIVEYSRFILDDIPNDVKIETNLEVAKIIFNLFVKGKTKSDRVVWEFTRHLSKCISKNKEIEAVELFENFIENNKISFKVKYLFLDCCLKENNVNHEIVRQFYGILKSSKILVPKVLNVFDDCKEKYSKESIYESEDEPEYVIYSSWTGRTDSEDEINKLRLIAGNGLAEHPEKIQAYWDRYPDVNPKDVSSYEFIEEMIFKSVRENQVFLPLEKLIAITKEAKITDKNILTLMNSWANKIDNPNLKKHLQIKDDPNTLHAIIKKRLKQIRKKSE